MIVEEGVREEEGEGTRGTERMKSISEIMMSNFHEWLLPSGFSVLLNADIVGRA